MSKRVNVDTPRDPAGAAPPQRIIGQMKEIILDPVTMLLWKLLAVFHDSIHDFGLNIDRMSSIVLYINHMVDELRIRSHTPPSLPSLPPPPLPLREQNGGRIVAMNRRKGIPGVGLNPRLAPKRPVYTETVYTDREETIERNAIKQIVIKPADNEAQYPLQYQQISYYNSCVDILNDSINPNSGKMLELFVHMNQLIEQIKLFVVFQIFDDIGGDAVQHSDITRNRVIGSIDGLYNLIRDNIDVNKEFGGTKDVILAILQMMKHIYTQLSNIRPDDEMNHAQQQPPPQAPQFVFRGEVGRFMDYKQRSHSSLYLDLFKGPLLHDILRVFLLNYFRVGSNVNDEAHIAYIVNELLISRDIQGGGVRRGSVRRGSVRHHYKMYGGSMVLSTFRAIDNESRDGLANTLIQWEPVVYRGPLPPSPPDQMAQIVGRYMDFFQRMILPPADGNRQLDPRLIRKLNIVTFGRLKDIIPLLNRKYQEQAGAIDGAAAPLVRMTRGALTNYGAELVKKMNEFMDQTKTDFDGLIAEEVAADEVNAAAAAAAPVPREHRIAVQQVSILIAQKGLEHARDNLNALLVLFPQPGQVAMLPQLHLFLRVALDYINSILPPPEAAVTAAAAAAAAGVARIQPPALLEPRAAGSGVVPAVPKEYDKYNNLMFELHLLELIYRHNGNGGLPDIDSRLIEYYRRQYLDRANPNGELAAYTDLVFCDDSKAQGIFQRVKADPRLFRVINNSVSRAVKDLIDDSTACPSSSKCDAMGSFGGCASDPTRNEFCSMGVVIRDTANVSNYMALTDVTEEHGNFFVKVVNQFNLGGLVVNSTHSRVDLQTNPTLLSANNVFKQALDTIVTLWKGNPVITPAELWDSLAFDANFKMLMDSVSQKGIGDIYQELNSIIAEAGYTGIIPTRIFNALQKITVGLAGDRPSAIRMMILLMYAPPLQNYLMRDGRAIVGYGNDANSFLVGHRDCIPLAGPALDPVNPRKRLLGKGGRGGRGGSLRNSVRTIKNKIYKKRHNNTKKRS